MKIRLPILFFLAAFCSTISCSTAQSGLSEIKLSPTKHILLLDSAAAAAAIVVDGSDGYFEKVSASEMSIQMKKPLAAGQTAASMRDAYAAFLKTDVENFTPDEAQFVVEVMEEVFKTCEAVSLGIFPNEIKLIKTKGVHYGESVYYTRENCIVVPENELQARERAAFLSTMYHEVFHVYSRMNSDKRKSLYKLIGFESIGYQNLALPAGLAERALFNPDGVDFAQKITLQTNDGKSIEAVPIIYANHVGFTPKKPDFFGYLEFNLFQIERDGSQWRVLTKDDGFTSTLDLKQLPDFFRQIKDNTHYIIHPDEVLADNFSFVMQSKNDSAVGSKFSAAGKQLLTDVEAVLKEDTSSSKDGRAPSDHGSNH